MWVDTGYRYFGGKACIVHHQTIYAVVLHLCDLLNEQLLQRRRGIYTISAADNFKRC